MIPKESFVGIPSSKIPGAPVDWEMEFELPGRCPHCGKFHMPHSVAFSYLNLGANSQFCTILLKCSECRSNCVAYYHANRSMQSCTFLGMYPNARAEVLVRKEILALSPLFGELYPQALACAAQGQFMQASVELRWAMSLLVKEYAVNVLGKKPKKVEQRSLNAALKTYLPKLKLYKRAETTRLLKSSYPKDAQGLGEKEFRLLKANADALQDEICDTLAKKARKNRKKRA